MMLNTKQDNSSIQCSFEQYLSCLFPYVCILMSSCELCLQEFDRQASATVKRMFDEIDGMLFEGIPFNGKWWYFKLQSLTKPSLNSLLTKVIPLQCSKLVVFKVTFW